MQTVGRVGVAAHQVQAGAGLPQARARACRIGCGGASPRDGDDARVSARRLPARLREGVGRPSACAPHHARSSWHLQAMWRNAADAAPPRRDCGGAPFAVAQNPGSGSTVVAATVSRALRPIVKLGAHASQRGFVSHHDLTESVVELGSYARSLRSTVAQQDHPAVLRCDICVGKAPSRRCGGHGRGWHCIRKECYMQRGGGLKPLTQTCLCFCASVGYLNWDW